LTGGAAAPALGTAYIGFLKETKTTMLGLASFQGLRSHLNGREFSEGFENFINNNWALSFSLISVATLSADKLYGLLAKLEDSR